jgi:hypothetical protein
LGSDANNELIEKGKKPFFNWISADNEIATARGGGTRYLLYANRYIHNIKNSLYHHKLSFTFKGGGLALWRRVTEKEDD